MPTIIVLPHAEICPEGKTFEGERGKSLLDNLLDQGIDVEHACEKSCACTTCHCIVRKGFDSLPPVDGGRGRPARSRVGPDAGVAAVVPGDRAGRAARRRDAEVHDQPRAREELTEDAMGLKWTDSRGDRDRARRSASGRRPGDGALHRPLQLGVARCPASTTIPSAPARRSSRRSRRHGSTRLSEPRCERRRAAPRLRRPKGRPKVAAAPLGQPHSPPPSWRGCATSRSD